MNLPVVAIIGRPNVGKSTLFNRLLRRRLAVTAETPGVTRDRSYARAEWAGRSFYLVDTGGYVPDSPAEIDRLVTAQARAAIAEADLILMVTDARVGLTDSDLKLSGLIRKRRVPVLHVVNKADDEASSLEVAGHARLALGEPYPVSAESGRGSGDMLDRLVALLPPTSLPPDPDSIRVAVLGRPNVGKSSLVNALVGSERIIVSAQPGTTRDAVDTDIESAGVRFTLVDTAGLRKRAKIDDAIEYFTTLRTLSALERSQVAVLVIEADRQFTTQDAHIASQIIDAGKGLVLAVNKWDLLSGEDHKKGDRFLLELRRRAPFVDFAPVVFIAAATGWHVARVLDSVTRVRQEMDRRVPTSALNDFLAQTIERKPPPAVRGKPVRIYYITQAQAGPAKFVLFASHPELITDSYRRFVHNQLRKRWGFTGVPIIISVRARS